MSVWWVVGLIMAFGFGGLAWVRFPTLRKWVWVPIVFALLAIVRAIFGKRVQVERVSNPNMLDAQRAQLLNSIVERAKIEAALENRVSEIHEVSEKEEARIRGLSAQQVADEFNALKKSRG